MLLLFLTRVWDYRRIAMNTNGRVLVDRLTPCVRIDDDEDKERRRKKPPHANAKTTE
jgi:hypothetical protein